MLLLRYRTQSRYLHYMHNRHAFFFFFNDTATTEIYTLSLHDALPISQVPTLAEAGLPGVEIGAWYGIYMPAATPRADRKSTRLNSSHLVISYAVFCLKKKKMT